MGWGGMGGGEWHHTCISVPEPELSDERDDGQVVTGSEKDEWPL